MITDNFGKSRDRYIDTLELYKRKASEPFPALSREILDTWLISDHNVLVLGYLLEKLGPRTFALDIGTFIGASAFCLARHENISKVVSVDPNPLLASEIYVNSDHSPEGSVEVASLSGLRVLDVARRLFKEFPEELSKIEFFEGVVGTKKVDREGGVVSGAEKLNFSDLAPDADHILALVDGLHTREGVQQDLEKIYKTFPKAISLLDDCRYGWGHYVQAGVVSFLENTSERYRFRVFCDLGPGFSKSSFGILYPVSQIELIDPALREMQKLFSERFDPVRLSRLKLAQQKQKTKGMSDLQDQQRKEIDDLRRKLTMLRKKRDKLQNEKAIMEENYSRLRYKAVDAIFAFSTRLTRKLNSFREAK